MIKLTWPINKTDTAYIKLTRPLKNWNGLQTQLKLKHCKLKLKLKPHWLLLSTEKHLTIIHISYIFTNQSYQA